MPQPILENELFTYCAAKVLGRAGELHIDSEQRDEISKAIAEVLSLEASAGRVDVRAQAAPAGPRDFKSVVYRGRRAGVTTEIALFRVKDTVTESWLPLLGVTLAVFHGAPSGAITSLVGTAKKIWDNFARLKRPQDADAIDVLEAIIKCRAKAMARGDEAYPSTGDILAAAPALSLDQALAALKKLAGGKWIESAEWADQEGDFNPAGNRWKVRL